MGLLDGLRRVARDEGWPIDGTTRPLSVSAPLATLSRRQYENFLEYFREQAESLRYKVAVTLGQAADRAERATKEWGSLYTTMEPLGGYGGPSRMTINPEPQVLTLLGQSGNMLLLGTDKGVVYKAILLSPETAHPDDKGLQELRYGLMPEDTARVGFGHLRRWYVASKGGTP